MVVSRDFILLFINLNVVWNLMVFCMNWVFFICVFIVLLLIEGWVGVWNFKLVMVLFCGVVSWWFEWVLLILMLLLVFFRCDFSIFWKLMLWVLYLGVFVFVILLVNMLVCMECSFNVCCVMLKCLFMLIVIYCFYLFLIIG